MVTKEREMPVGYDKLSLDHNLLFDLPFREGIGAITQDIAKPHHPVTLVNTPTWATLASNLGVLELDGATEYLQSLAADTVDLDFIATDYSIGCWFNWEVSEDDQHIIGRYRVDLDGWEVYLYQPNETLTLRHHHSLGATLRTACYSFGWTQNVWHFIGISRSGDNALHYRNGMSVPSTVSLGGLIDPESNNDDLVIGARFDKGSEYFKGPMWRPRIWNRALEPWEWLELFNFERHFFGV